jgi:hypothetical protein
MMKVFDLDQQDEIPKGIGVGGKEKVEEDAGTKREGTL